MTLRSMIGHTHTHTHTPCTNRNKQDRTIDYKIDTFYGPKVAASIPPFLQDDRESIQTKENLRDVPLFRQAGLCMYTRTCMFHGLTASMLHGCVCSTAYLWSGSRILCTHWDSHSERWKMNDGRFLHFDRRDCSLQYETDIHLCTIRLFNSIFRVCSNFCCEEAS